MNATVTDNPSPQQAQIDANTPIFELNGKTWTVADARNGVMMREDYTQKTQQLSEDRRELEQSAKFVAALERAPKDTLATAMRHFDLTPEDFGAPPAAELAGEPGANQVTAPQTPAEVAELRQEVAQMKQEQVDAQVRMELEAIVAQDSAIDPQLLVQRTIDGNMPSFEATYKMMLGEGHVPVKPGEAAPPVEEAAPPPAETAPPPEGIAPAPLAAPVDQNVLAQKREQAATVSTGGGAPEGVAAPDSPTKFADPRQAVEATLAQLQANGQLTDGPLNDF